ncbi:MAG TPA: MASE1 domain-containing protein, partial [Gemmatimonadales bacterium]|nr:MASE1 domain-containing protein [Gemmatimonadales bacterium]
MRPRVPPHPTLVYLGKVVMLAAAYYATARLGLSYASIGRSVSLIWPPSGIAFAALALLGYRYWPGVAAGAFLANAATGIPILASLGIASGNTLEAFLAAFLLRRATGGRPQLTDLGTVRTLVLLAAPLGALCSAIFGTLSLLATGALPGSLAAAAAVWWTGDLLGMLVVGPAFLAWGTARQEGDSTRRLIELLLL